MTSPDEVAVAAESPDNPAPMTATLMCSSTRRWQPRSAARRLPWVDRQRVEQGIGRPDELVDHRLGGLAHTPGEQALAQRVDAGVVEQSGTTPGQQSASRRRNLLGSEGKQDGRLGRSAGRHRQACQ